MQIYLKLPFQKREMKECPAEKVMPREVFGQVQLCRHSQATAAVGYLAPAILTWCYVYGAGFAGMQNAIVTDHWGFQQCSRGNLKMSSNAWPGQFPAGGL